MSSRDLLVAAGILCACGVRLVAGATCLRCVTLNSMAEKFASLNKAASAYNQATVNIIARLNDGEPR